MDFFKVGEFGAEASFVEVALAVLFFVFDDDDGATVAEDFDDAEPVVEVGVFFAGVGDEDVDGAFGKEELVGGVVDLLAAEVPDVRAEFSFGVVVDFPAYKVDAFSRFFFGLELIAGVLELVG